MGTVHIYIYIYYIYICIYIYMVLVKIESLCVLFCVLFFSVQIHTPSDSLTEILHGSKKSEVAERQGERDLCELRSELKKTRRVFRIFFWCFFWCFVFKNISFLLVKKKPQAQVFGVQNPEEKDKTTKKTSKGI